MKWFLAQDSTKAAPWIPPTHRRSGTVIYARSAWTAEGTHVRNEGRFLLATFLVIGGLLLGLGVYQWQSEGSLDPLAVARVAFLLLGLGILLRFALGAPSRSAILLCPRCRSRIFETRSPSAALPLLTCFGCGLEVQAPAPKRARRPERRPPQEYGAA